ncbi:hypothetical protein DSO57_1032728 [Entomophthora muscae]|uniref:Uncharacterized protein n=1 Tax=Entomophthora muscae TaxID=34485 RepID=A0ACC2S2E1_9FUNG|nr:hypothetical protein DSO57_1032728 [Entomophthora muscae]
MGPKMSSSVQSSLEYLDCRLPAGAPPIFKVSKSLHKYLVAKPRGLRVGSPESDMIEDEPAY